MFVLFSLVARVKHGYHFSLTCGLLKGIVEGRDAKFEVENAGKWASASFNETMTWLALDNAVGNAVTHGKRDSPIRLVFRFDEQKERLCFTLTNLPKLPLEMATDKKVAAVSTHAGLNHIGLACRGAGGDFSFNFGDGGVAIFKLAVPATEVSSSSIETSTSVPSPLCSNSNISGIFTGLKLHVIDDSKMICKGYERLLLPQLKVRDHLSPFMYRSFILSRVLNSQCVHFNCFLRPTSPTHQFVAHKPKRTCQHSWKDFWRHPLPTSLFWIRTLRCKMDQKRSLELIWQRSLDNETLLVSFASELPMRKSLTSMLTCNLEVLTCALESNWRLQMWYRSSARHTQPRLVAPDLGLPALRKAASWSLQKLHVCV